jgi:methylated-DNA-protein-cysteine methyltransferase-like protein
MKEKKTSSKKNSLPAKKAKAKATTESGAKPAAASKGVKKKAIANKKAATTKTTKTKVLIPPAAKKAAVTQKKKAGTPVKEPKKYSFFDDVWDVVRQIPKGRVTNYGAIAKYLGSGLSSRMVGWALNATGADDSIPAQRVVNRNGILSAKAHFGGNRMQELLEADGVTVEKDTVVDFKTLHWDPAVELGL